MEEKRGWYFTMATLFIRSGWGWGRDGGEGRGKSGAWNPGGKSPWQGRSKFPYLPLAWGGLEATWGPLGGS